MLANGIPHVSQEILNALTLLTLGSQFRGSYNTMLGQKATKRVFQLIRETVKHAIEDEDSRSILIRNAAGRQVRIEFSPDPDIAIKEQLGSGRLNNRIAIEIKEGTSATIHPRSSPCDIIAYMKRLFRLLVRVLGLLLLAAILAFGVLVWQVDRLGERDDAQAADAIVVLGARVLPDGSPGSDLTSRILHGLDLWRLAYAPHIICTGGFKDEPLSAAAVCRRYAVDWGVPANQVWLADDTTNTIEDAASTARVMAAQGWRSAILVSHPLHLYRARWLFRRVGLDVVTSPTTTETQRILLPLRVWYATREAGAILITVLDERGWISPDWTARLQTWSYALP